MQDLVAGQIDIMIDAPAVVLPQLRAGTIKAFAVLAERRLAQAAEVPTADRGWTARLPSLQLVRALGAQRHRQGHYRQTQCRNRKQFGRTNRAPKIR